MQFQVTIDANDPARLADFWMVALEYIIQPPPPEFESWDDWARAMEIPEENWNDARALVDPTGVGPRLFFQKVPEGKTDQKLFHLDVSAAADHRDDPEARTAAIQNHVDRLVAAGATRVEEFNDFKGHWVVMLDPEDNEFCVQ